MQRGSGFPGPFFCTSASVLKASGLEASGPNLPFAHYPPGLREPPGSLNLRYTQPGKCKKDWRVIKSSHRGSKSAGNIYIGVGGWTFAPWRGVFYPEKLKRFKKAPETVFGLWRIIYRSTSASLT
jgi:hypothetical protein